MNKRYIPDNSVEIKDVKLGYAIYKYSQENKPFLAIAYSGKKTRSDWNINFKTEESRSETIEEQINICIAAAKEKLAIREEKKTEKDCLLKSMKIGDLYYSSFGYEQTNLNFYQLINIKGYQVTFQEVEQEIVRSGDMQGEAIAIKDKFLNDTTYTKRIGSKYLKLDTYTSLHKWDGKPKYFSSYY